MSTTHEYSTEETAIIFFRHVKRDLGIYSTRQVVNLVSRVIDHVLSGMSVQQAFSFVHRLPDLFQLLFINRWKGDNASRKTYTHLDEIVDNIYREDRVSANSSLRSEVEALNAVVVILKKLDRHLNLLSHNILKYHVVEELKQIHMETTVGD